MSPGDQPGDSFPAYELRLAVPPPHRGKKLLIILVVVFALVLIGKVAWTGSRFIEPSKSEEVPRGGGTVLADPSPAADAAEVKDRSLLLVNTTPGPGNESGAT